MDNNDFLGSFAQENVAFTTQVIRTASVGDNYWKTMIFIENDRFVDPADLAWMDVPGVTGAKAMSVTADDYVEHMKIMEEGDGANILQSWLTDLFVNGNIFDCILVTCGPSFGEEAVANFTATMTNAYNALRAYAYHKTICACPVDSDTATAMSGVLPALAVAFARLCAGDKGLLSSVPYLPFTTITPELPESDPLYAALSSANVDAFMGAYQDPSRNAALYSLGIALSTYNRSGTPVGNSIDMSASQNIQSSGSGGLGLPKGVRDQLQALNIQTFKPVGNNTGSCAAIGAKTIMGDMIQATWIIAYVTYMVKVRVAEMLTSPNFLKSAANYTRIINVMGSILSQFGPGGSGRLDELAITAPSFGSLPEAQGDEIIIPNAWSAAYVDQVRSVKITGTLYIGM